MPYPCVSIQVVTWNSMRFLPELLNSIMGQSYRDFNVLVIDNASTDGVETFVREEHPNVVFIRNPRNLGACAAQNQAMRYALEHWPADSLQDHFVLVVSPEALLTPAFLEQLMAATRAHPETGSFGGKILRAYGENLVDEVLKQTIQSDRIDSTGLFAHRNQTMTNRGAGELDKGQYDQQEQVFGFSGALALFRASALQEIRFGDEIFDQDFFAYKEDMDLAWRLQQAGRDALYVPTAVAYHYRGMYEPEKSGLWERLRVRRSNSVLQNFFSTRNQWFMLIKNLRLVHALLALPWIVGHEIPRFVYMLFFEPAGRRAFKETIQLLPRMLKKRRQTFRRTKRPAKELRQWFV